MRRSLLAAVLTLLSLAPSLPAKGMDYDLERAYKLLDRGQEHRARALFKEYLDRDPNSAWAREGYVKAGGDLAELGLASAEAKPRPKPVATEDNAPKPVEDEAEEAEENAPVRLGDAQTDADTVVLTPNPGGERRSFAKRALGRLRGAGRVAVGILALLAILGVVVLMGWLGLRLAAWHRARNLEKLLRLARHAGGSVYVAPRWFTPWWGLAFDSDAEVNAVLEAFRREGWVCESAGRDSWLFPTIPAPQRAMTILLTGVSGGFLQYYIGPNLLLRRGQGSAPQPEPEAEAPAPQPAPPPIETA